MPTIGEVVSLARLDREQSLGAAAAAFLAQPGLAPQPAAPTSRPSTSWSTSSAPSSPSTS